MLVLLNFRSLITFLEDALLNCEPHSRAFALRIFGQQYKLEIQNLPHHTEFFYNTTYGGYPEVASMGYAFGCSSLVSDNNKQIFLDGIKRLIDRPIKSISGDDIAILGIADGIRKIKLLNSNENFTEIENWLINVVEQKLNNKAWSFRLRDLALDLLDNKGRLRVSFDVSHISTIASEIVMRFVWPQQFLGVQNPLEEVINRTIKEILIVDINNMLDFEEVAIWLKAMDEVLNYEIVKHASVPAKTYNSETEQEVKSIMNEQIDVVIITALEEEKDAVLRYLDNYEEKCVSNRTYYKGNIIVQGKFNSYRIVVLCLHQMGNVAAGIITTQAISIWNPLHIILTGIAGGVKDEHKRFLGDLLVADQIVGYELGKLTNDDIKRRYQVLRPAYGLLQAAHNLSPEKWVFTSKAQRPDGSSGRTIPMVHFGAVASGEKVVADNDLVQEIQESWAKLIGVEMEAYGTALAAYISDTTPGMLMVKAICDWADPSKNDDWHKYAADIAAAYTIALLKTTPFESREKPQAEKKESIVTYGGKTKLEICRRLGNNWRELADYFEIPLYERNTFEPGNEPRRIWEWLEVRKKLSGMGNALEEIGRKDLATILESSVSD